MNKSSEEGTRMLGAWRRMHTEEPFRSAMLVCLLICMKIEAQLVLCTRSCACAVPTCSTQHVHTARSKVTQYCSISWCRMEVDHVLLSTSMLPAARPPELTILLAAPVQVQRLPCGAQHLCAASEQGHSGGAGGALHHLCQRLPGRLPGRRPAPRRDEL